MGLNQKQKEKSKSTLPKILQGSVSSAQSQCTQSAHALQFDRRTHILGTDARNKGKSAAVGPLHFCVLYIHTHTQSSQTGSIIGASELSDGDTVCVRVHEAACGFERMLAPWRKSFVFMLFSHRSVFVSVFMLFTCPCCWPINNNNQTGWNIDLCVGCVHPHLFQSSSSLLILSGKLWPYFLIWFASHFHFGD